MPPEQSENPSVQDPRRIQRCAAAPDVLWCQHHNGIWRSTGNAPHGQEITAPLSSFGFRLAVHPQDPDTARFLPAVADQQRVPVSPCKPGNETLPSVSDGRAARHIRGADAASPPFDRGMSCLRGMSVPTAAANNSGSGGFFIRPAVLQAALQAQRPRRGDQDMTQTFKVGARSLFVETTAWVAILLALLASMSALVQNAEVASVLPAWRDGSDSLLPFTRLLLAYLPWVMGGGFVLSVALLATAIGLLMRQEWARRAFIGLLLVVIVANLSGLWLQYEVVRALVDGTLRTSPLPAQAAGVFGGLADATQWMAMAVTLIGCALLGWVIRGLMSEAVRQEFA
jgi:hypothetical protein